MLQTSLTRPCPSGKTVIRPGCLDIRDRFGRRFKIEYEESYRAERPEFRTAEALWLTVIPCRHGHICPWGGDNLAACTKTAGPVARRLKALPFVDVAQDGSDGVNVVFHVEHLEEVAAIMQPRRRRVLSEPARVRLAEAGARTRFGRGIQTAPNERPCVPMPLDDFQAVQPLPRVLPRYHADFPAPGTTLAVEATP